jgi:hypothetical protein
VDNSDECPLHCPGSREQRGSVRELATAPRLSNTRVALLSSHRLDWLVLRRPRFCMTTMKADVEWDSHWCDPRYAPMPHDILEVVVSKVSKSRQQQPVAPVSVVGPVSADRLRWSAHKRPRYRHSPPRGDESPPRYSDPPGNRVISPDTGSGRYARGASVASQRGSSERLRYRSTATEFVTDDSMDRNAPHRHMASHASRLGSASGREPLLDAVEAGKCLLETQRVDLAPSDR